MPEKLKTLIVEDSKLAQAIYDELLIDRLFEKRFADDGQAALEIYHDWKPDIILLDIMLPVLSGYLVLKTIRVKSKDNSTAIVMLTSLSKKDDVMDCMRLGIQGYIVKAPDYDKFGAKILQYYSKVNPKRAEELLGELDED